MRRILRDLAVPFFHHEFVKQASTLFLYACLLRTRSSSNSSRTCPSHRPPLPSDPCLCPAVCLMRRYCCCCCLPRLLCSLNPCWVCWACLTCQANRFPTRFFFVQALLLGMDAPSQEPFLGLLGLLSETAEVSTSQMSKVSTAVAFLWLSLLHLFCNWLLSETAEVSTSQMSKASKS